MGVSLFSAAATSVSMFNAEPNPVREHISKIPIKNGKFVAQWRNWKLLAEVTPREVRTKPGEEDSIDGALAAFCD